MNLCLACNAAEPVESLAPFCSVECLHADPRQSKNPVLQRILSLFEDRETGAGGPGGMLPTTPPDDRLRWYLAGALDARATSSGTAPDPRLEFDPQPRRAMVAEVHHHEAKCWARYEPCGEHHAHSYSCGGGELGPECPKYVPPLQKSKVEPRHDKLGREWFADWHRYHRRYEWRDRDSLPQRAYAQGCANQENRTKAETIEHMAEVAEAAGAAGNSPDLLAFAASLRDGSWETQVTFSSQPPTPKDGS